MVVICWPSAAETGVTQDRSGVPLRCTVQAPHWAMPQPNLVPVRFRLSRSTHRSGVSGSTSISWLLPFTVSLIIVISEGAFSIASRARRCGRRGRPHYVTAPPCRQPEEAPVRSLRVLVLDPRRRRRRHWRCAPGSPRRSPSKPPTMRPRSGRGGIRVCLGRPIRRGGRHRLPDLEWVQSTWAGAGPCCPCSTRVPKLVATAAKGIFGDAIAEYVLGWLIALDRRLLDYGAQQRGRSGRRCRTAVWPAGACYCSAGSIGRRVADRLTSFDMEVVGVSRAAGRFPASRGPRPSRPG